MNRVAIVTGGAVRIGRELSLRLAHAGCDVCVHCHHSRKEADEVVKQIKQSGCRAISVQADLVDAVESAELIVKKCRSRLGPATILVNNAAIFESATLESTRADVWRRHMDLNLSAPVFLSQAFARQLPDGARGDIINILDWRAERPAPGHLPYTLSKAGLAALTKLLALELAPKVHVNGIALGAILPPPGMKPSAFQKLAGAIPLQRTGSPQDVADAMIYLLESRFVTGEVVHVTGGV